MIELTRKRLLVGGLFIHVYVLVAWFCAMAMDVKFSGSPLVPHSLILLISVSAVSGFAVVLYVVFVREIVRDLLLRIYLISPMAATVMTAVRLSARPVAAIKWTGSILAIVIATFGFATFYAERHAQRPSTNQHGDPPHPPLRT